MLHAITPAHGCTATQEPAVAERVIRSAQPVMDRPLGLPDPSDVP